MLDEKSSLTEPLLATQTVNVKSRVKRIVKYVISFGLLSFILHRALFPLAFRYASTHIHPCVCDNYAWAMDAFAPKEPEVPIGQLAENFFL
jgi:hypothetical protein